MSNRCPALIDFGGEDDQNARMYHHDYPPLAGTVRGLHSLGFTVRLSLMLVDGFVDRISRLQNTITWCKEHDVEQLTIRPIRQPTAAQDEEVGAFVEKHALSTEREKQLTSWVRSHQLILRLSHGVEIYDVFGQNVCLTDCLTIPEEPDQIRTLIYYSNGRLAYDWQYSGAVLLGGQGPEQ